MLLMTFQKVLDGARECVSCYGTLEATAQRREGWCWYEGGVRMVEG